MEISRQLPTFQMVVCGRHETGETMAGTNWPKTADLSQPKVEARFSEQPSTNAMHNMNPELGFICNYLELSAAF